MRDLDGGTGTVMSITAGYLLAAVWYIVNFEILSDAGPLTVPAELLEALNLTVIIATLGGLVYSVRWLHRAELSSHAKWLVALWSIGGLLGSVVIVLFLQANWIVEGVAPPPEWLVQQYLIAGGVGTIGGTLVGGNTALLYRSQGRLASQRDAFRVINEFLRHHVLNGMQVVLGYTDLLRDDASEQEAAWLSDIDERGAGIVDLVQRVNVFMESVAGETELHPVPLDNVVAESVQEIRERSPRVHIEVDTESAVTVVGDKLLEDVIQNILRNAVEHNDTFAPRIDISIRTTPSTAIVRIADNGPGVPDALKRGIFEPGEPSPRQVGHGFGLYLVDTLVTRYGGTVTVEDRDGWWNTDLWMDSRNTTGAVFNIELKRAPESGDSRGFAG